MFAHRAPIRQFVKFIWVFEMWIYLWNCLIFFPFLREKSNVRQILWCTLHIYTVFFKICTSFWNRNRLRELPEQFFFLILWHKCPKFAKCNSALWIPIRQFIKVLLGFEVWTYLWNCLNCFSLFSQKILIFC